MAHQGSHRRQRAFTIRPGRPTMPKVKVYKVSPKTGMHHRPVYLWAVDGVHQAMIFLGLIAAFLIGALAFQAPGWGLPVIAVLAAVFFVWRFLQHRGDRFRKITDAEEDVAEAQRTEALDGVVHAPEIGHEQAPQASAEPKINWPRRIEIAAMVANAVIWFLAAYQGHQVRSSQRQFDEIDQLLGMPGRTTGYGQNFNPYPNVWQQPPRSRVQDESRAYSEYRLDTYRQWNYGRPPTFAAWKAARG